MQHYWNLLWTKAREESSAFWWAGRVDPMWWKPNHRKLGVNLLLSSPQSAWLTLAARREKDQIRHTDCADWLYLLCHPPPGWCLWAPSTTCARPALFERLIDAGAEVSNPGSSYLLSRYCDEPGVKARVRLRCLDRSSKVKSVAHPPCIKHTNAAWRPVRLLPPLYLSIFIPAVTRLVRFDLSECCHCLILPLVYPQHVLVRQLPTIKAHTKKKNSENRIRSQKGRLRRLAYILPPILLWRAQAHSKDI